MIENLDCVHVTIFSAPEGACTELGVATMAPAGKPASVSLILVFLVNGLHLTLQAVAVGAFSERPAIIRSFLWPAGSGPNPRPQRHSLC